MTTPASRHTASINDMQMYYELHGDGAPLVLLHGFFGSSGDWGSMIDTLARDHRLIIPDLRGHGRSTNPSGRFTLRQSALDVLALLDLLGIERCKAIGISGGAKTLLHVASRQPDRLEAQVLVSATPWFPDEARALMGLVSADSQPESEWQSMRERHKHGDDQIRDLWRQANAFKDSYDDMNFTPPLLSTIRARTLIVHGDRDPMYPNRLALEMREAIPRAWLWIIPNGGHSPVFGDINGLFLTTALEFLRGGFELDAMPDSD